MGKLKILVVDDNRDFCDSVKDILEAEGYEVLTAYDGRSALDLLRREQVDLILMDLIMPGMDGVATIKVIRETLLTVPITVVTAFGEESVVQDAFMAGANKKIDKPIDFNRLLADISKSG